MAAWEHQPCGTVFAAGKNPPLDCGFCSTLLVPLEGERQGWRRVDHPVDNIEWAEGFRPRTRRRSISPGQRARIYKRDGYRCVECGCDDEELLTIDHRVPVAKGGTNEDANLQTMCQPCNQRKADSLISPPARLPRSDD